MLLGLLLALLIAGQAQAQDTTDVTVRQINELRQTAVDSLNAICGSLMPECSNLIVPLTESAFDNQLVRFTAVLLSNPRTSGLGNPDANGFPSRIHVYVRDTSVVAQGNEGMGIQLVDARLRNLVDLPHGDVRGILRLRLADYQEG